NLVGEYCNQQTGRSGIKGDGDPLDICVLSERAITHGDILLKVIPIGGLRMIDGQQADDKIIAVLRDDIIYGKFQTIEECPQSLIDRLRHSFLTYKMLPGVTANQVEITHVYSRAEAFAVIEASIADYQEEYGDADAHFQALRRLLERELRGQG